MRESEHRKLRQLASKTVDGIASADEQHELGELLLASNEARDLYRDYIGLHTELERRPPHPLPNVIFTPRARPTKVILAMAALLALSALSLWQMIWNKPSGDAPLAGDPSTLPATLSGTQVNLAIVGSTQDLRPADPSQAPLREGSMVSAGTLHYQSGSIRLDYFSGARMTLVAPFKLEVVNSGEVFLHRGRLAARIEKPGFIVRIPTGAIVDLGTEFSVNVADSGEAAIKVFQGAVEVSKISNSGNTREGVRLEEGESIAVGERFETLSDERATEFLRQVSREIPPLHVGATYPEVITQSTPAGYWRFEETGPEGQIKDEMGRDPMLLRQGARLAGISGARYLLTHPTTAVGFAELTNPLSGLNGPHGCSVELWYYSESNRHGTIATLELAGSPPRTEVLPKVHHAPGLLVIERMGLEGSKLGHVHPDFAVRYLFRSPPGYIGGINSYSRESHLLNRWVHLVVVRDQERMQLFVDGLLSEELHVDLPIDDNSYHFILGRLHTQDGGDARQWIGGIDEVSLYRRALSAAEVARHYQAATNK